MFIAAGTVLAIFVIMAVGFLVLWQKASATYTRIDDIDSHFQKIQLTLNEIRDDLTQSPIHAIDCPGNPAECAAEIPRRISTLRTSADRHLTSLEGPLPPSDSAKIRQLRAQMTDFWNSLEAVNSQDLWNSLRKGKPLKPPVNVPSRPLRASLNSLVSNVDDLSRTSLSRQQDSIRTVEQNYHSYVRLVALTSLILIAITAAAGLFRISQLQRIITQEQTRAIRAEQELRSLAQKLLEVQEYERRQISRELHDEVGQLLTGLRMELGSLGKLDSRTSMEYEERLGHAKTLAEDAVRSIRNIAMLLRPPMLDDIGLEPALRWQAKEFSSRLGVPVNVDIRANLSGLPDRYTTCLYRITQEALTNCAKHAGAKEIQIRLRDTDDGIILTVDDDGVGFNPQKKKSAGLGLIGIEERARELNGRAVIFPRDGGGTCVEVELPLPASVVS